MLNLPLHLKKSVLALVLVLVLVATASISFGQDGHSIPLDTPLRIQLLSVDTTAFPFENVHYFSLNNEGTRIEASFLIDKEQDYFKATGDATVVLSRNYGYTLRGPQGQKVYMNGCRTWNGFYLIDESNATSTFYDFNPKSESPTLRVKVPSGK